MRYPNAVGPFTSAGPPCKGVTVADEEEATVRTKRPLALQPVQGQGDCGPPDAQKLSQPVMRDAELAGIRGVKEDPSRKTLFGCVPGIAAAQRQGLLHDRKGVSQEGVTEFRDMTQQVREERLPHSHGSQFAPGNDVQDWWRAGEKPCNPYEPARAGCRYFQPSGVYERSGACGHEQARIDRLACPRDEFARAVCEQLGFRADALPGRSIEQGQERVAFLTGPERFRRTGR